MAGNTKDTVEYDKEKKISFDLSEMSDDEATSRTASIADDTSSMSTSLSWAQLSYDISKKEKSWNALISLISGLYALVLVVLGFGFEIAVITVDQKLAARYEFFYIYLYVGGLVFLIYCDIFMLKIRVMPQRLKFQRLIPSRLRRATSKSEVTFHPDAMTGQSMMSAKRIVTHSAPAAGSLYLRLGAIMFGTTAVVYKTLHCFELHSQIYKKRVDFVSTILSGIFIFVQIYFLFRNYKLTVHRMQNIARIGFMHLVATNLCVWIKSVVIEEFEALEELEKELHLEHAPIFNFSSFPASDHHGRFVRSHADHAESNVHSTKASTGHDTGHSGHHVSSTITPGHSLPAMAVRHNISDILTEIKPFLNTCLIEYSIICAAIMFVLWMNIGYRFFKRQKYRKQNIRVDCSSSSRGLFMGLIFVVITFASVAIFFMDLSIGSRASETQAMWVYFITRIVLYLVSILACLACAFQWRHLHYQGFKHHRALLLDDILLIVALIGQLMYCFFNMVGLTMVNQYAIVSISTSLLRVVQVLIQTVIILAGQRLVAATREAQTKKPGRELVTFLLIINIALWLINSLETQKVSSNTELREFYGSASWYAIVHCTVPLTIFYRFHSSVCLAEIWKNAYKVKASH